MGKYLEQSKVIKKIGHYRETLNFLRSFSRTATCVAALLWS